MSPFSTGLRGNRLAIVFLIVVLAIAGLEVWAIASGLAELLPP
jgi:hypothetical protein